MPKKEGNALVTFLQALFLHISQLFFNVKSTLIYNLNHSIANHSILNCILIMGSQSLPMGFHHCKCKVKLTLQV